VDRPRDPRAGRRSPLKRLLARIRRRLRPPRTLRPTRAGWAFFAITLGVGFAALNTGNNLLYLVFSFLLAFLVLSGVMSEAALRNLHVRRRPGPEIFAGKAARIPLEVHNAQKLVPSYAVVVEELAGATVWEAKPLGRAFLLRVGPGESAEAIYRLEVEQRGPLALAGFRVSTRFPFGLFAKSLLIPDAGQRLIYPGLEPLHAAALSGAKRERGEQAGARTGIGTDAAGLRGFAFGDTPRAVHWPASLRRGSLLVRDREREERPELEIQLRVAGRAPGEGFERDVRRAASEIVAHLDAGFRVGLRTERHREPPGDGAHHRTRLLTFLARVEPGPTGVGREAA